MNKTTLKTQLKNQFNEIFKNCKIAAVQLNGFTHIFYKHNPTEIVYIKPENLRRYIKE